MQGVLDVSPGPEGALVLDLAFERPGREADATDPRYDRVCDRCAVELAVDELDVRSPRRGW